MGVRRFVVAINKIDTVSDADQRVSQITADLISRLGDIGSVSLVAVSGTRGDNVTSGDATLLDLLDSGVTSSMSARASLPLLRIPIQGVIRERQRRWYTGRIASGEISRGDSITIWPSGDSATVSDVSVAGASTAIAVGAGRSVAIELDRETDVGRGDMILGSQGLPVSRAHLADLVWLDPEPLNSRSSYVLRVGPLEVPARVEQIRFAIDLEAGKELAASVLSVNDIGRVEITCDRPVFLDSFTESRHTGGFILCDRLTGHTVAAGMSVHPLQRESEVTRHAFSMNRHAREKLNGIRSGVLWLTGLPGSGKSSIADEVEKHLFGLGLRAYVLDGDTVRQTLSEDLGFSPEHRRENVRRVARTAQLFMDAGIITIVSLVSPFRADRDAARELFAREDFAEVFVDTPLEVCQSRDPKGLYARAASSAHSQMTGAGQAYEPPLSPDVHLDGTTSIVENAATLVNWITSRRVR
jgi:bifunctional enzyme CysN/CysC